MKKYLLFLGVLIAFCLPMKAEAFHMTRISMHAPTEVHIGEEFQVELSIAFDGFSEDGLLIVEHELNYDPSIFTIQGAISDDWDTSLLSSDGKYYLSSEMRADGNILHTCSNGIMVCSDYKLTLVLSVNSGATPTVTQMGYGDIQLLTMPILSDLSQYTEQYMHENMEIISDYSNSIHTIYVLPAVGNIPVVDDGPGMQPIEQDPGTVIQTPVVVPPVSNPVVSEPTPTPQVRMPLLKSLQIENYDFNFDPNKNKYDLTVERGVNSLSIVAEVENGADHYEVIGADDLKANGYRVLIQVNSDDGGVNTYTISVKNKHGKQAVNTGAEEKKSFAISKKYLMIGGGILFGIIVVILIVKKISDRRFEKSFKDL